MGWYLRNLHFRLLVAMIIAILLSGCASGQKEPLFIAPDFRQMEIRDIALLPVTFEERYAPPPGLDLEQELRHRAASVLEQKGYRISRGSAPKSGADGSAAAMAIHVDFLFITETYGDITPPPVIDIEAVGELVSTSSGEVLWRGRGVGKVGGVGGGGISRPVSARHIALTVLVESLFASLPEASGRR